MPFVNSISTWHRFAALGLIFALEEVRTQGDLRPLAQASQERLALLQPTRQLLEPGRGGIVNGDLHF